MGGATLPPVGAAMPPAAAPPAAAPPPAAATPPAAPAAPQGNAGQPAGVANLPARRNAEPAPWTAGDLQFADTPAAPAPTQADVARQMVDEGWDLGGRRCLSVDLPESDTSNAGTVHLSDGSAHPAVITRDGYNQVTSIQPAPPPQAEVARQMVNEGWDLGGRQCVSVEMPDSDVSNAGAVHLSDGSTYPAAITRDGYGQVISVNPVYEE